MPQPSISMARKVYTALDESGCLELIALENTSDLAALEHFWHQSWLQLGMNLSGDFKRQLLRYVEAPKNIDTALPETRYIQMRHVEVKRAVYQDYLVWRDRTIFEVVRQAPEVEVFLAYHSLISSEPGVMFVSGFSGLPEQYESIFTTPAYKEIVAQAGNRYITGGERGLYTKIYRAV